MPMINHIALRHFYLTRKAAYNARRGSGEQQQWDEAYKWELLPAANKSLEDIGVLTAANASEVQRVIQTYRSNFAHWIDMDDLKLLLDKPNGYQVIAEVWKPQAATIATAIDSANNLSNASFMLGKKFSPSTYGYLLAVQDCDTFAIYRDSVYQILAEISGVAKPAGKTQGEKYQLLNDSARYVGELMQAEAEQYRDLPWHTALNGQDFIYVTTQYDT